MGLGAEEDKLENAREAELSSRRGVPLSIAPDNGVLQGEVSRREQGKFRA
jgi:hypothetical protein